MDKNQHVKRVAPSVMVKLGKAHYIRENSAPPLFAIFERIKIMSLQSPVVHWKFDLVSGKAPHDETFQISVVYITAPHLRENFVYQVFHLMCGQSASHSSSATRNMLY